MNGKTALGSNMTCLLSDSEILESVKKGHLVIRNFSGSVEPASYDLRMGNRVISLTRGKELEQSDGRFIIQPSELVLVESMEKVGFPLDLQGRICSKVSLLRKGFSSIATKIDPGYGYPDGWNLLLVFHHCGHEPIELRPGDPVCSLEFEKLDQPASKSYTGKHPKTILLRPIEAIDPLAGQKLDFTKLKKDDLEKFYGHPLDDIFLALGALQKDLSDVKARLPRRRPLWKTALIVYLLYFAICGILLMHINIAFPSVADISIFLAGVGIGAGVIGGVLGIYAKTRNEK